MTHSIAMPNPFSSSSPSPLPPPAAQRRRRCLLAPQNPSPTPASSSSSSSSASSNLSFSFSPAPSPFHHRFLSPHRASAVPFSWEHRPGIPKTPARKPRAKPTPLPLPPSLFSNRVVAEYPYGATAGGDDCFVIAQNNTKTRRRRGMRQRRRWPALTDALTDWLAVLSLYRSCTRSHDCLAAAGPPPGPRPCAPA